ncbi:MAG: ABC transporter ATP-binding protein [Calditrichaeota bacterium]|nr:MAG: ABC transporter ATP-binding protein [Calditrichota bacterium]
MKIQLKDIQVLAEPASGNAGKIRLDLSWEFSTEDKIGIVGLSGSGKTTLLQVIAGLIDPDSGMILVDDRDISKDKSAKNEYKNQFGVCFQFPEMQIFEPTVGDDIAFGLQNMKMDHQEIKQQIANALFDVGLVHNEFLMKSIRGLSQGEKRRVAMAGILVMQKPVLLLDEPTSGLDAVGIKKIKETLGVKLKSANRGLMIISHDLDFLLRTVDELWLMENGKIIESMRCDELDYHKLNRFIEIPRSYRLQQHLLKLGIQNTPL